MLFVKGETVRVADLRGNHNLPSGMKMYSGQIAQIVDVFDSPENLNVYYTITIDDGQSVWPETMLKKVDDPDAEYIDQIVMLISEIDTTCGKIKELLWRKKHNY